jgi:hypothetical protein
MYAKSASAPQRKLWIRRPFANLISNLRPIRRFGKNLLNCKRKHVDTNGTGPAHLSVPMKVRRLKRIIVSAFSFVLLYYSVAWAVLNCFDGEDQFHHGIVASNVGSYNPPEQVSFSGRERNLIDCAPPEYHVETLAAPVSPALLVRSPADSRSHSADFLGGNFLAGAAARGFGFSYSFQRTSTPSQLSDVPLYLSLAVFRI